VSEGHEPERHGRHSSLLGRLNHQARLWITALIFELRRTRRVIVPPDAPRTGEPPIFVLGAHRSGTTLLRLILDTHSRIACPPESFFLQPLGSVLADDKAMEGLAAMGFDRQHVLARLRESASYFFETYAASHGKPRWADKTPSYVSSLDLIEALFGPACQYVVIYRHGLDSARSLAGVPIRELDAYADAPLSEKLVAAARFWAEGCEKLRAFREAHRERCFEVRYEELTREPEPVLRSLFSFLGEEFEPQLLRFYESPHDSWIGLQDTKAAESRGFTPRIGTWREVDPDVLRRMIAVAGPTLRALGYSVDEPGGGGAPD
jgi:hypothetical protein